MGRLNTYALIQQFNKAKTSLPVTMVKVDEHTSREDILNQLDCPGAITNIALFGVGLEEIYNKECPNFWPGQLGLATHTAQAVDLVLEQYSIYSKEIMAKIIGSDKKTDNN